MLTKGYTHYTGNFGDNELIKEIASFMKDEFNINYSSDEIMITTSATHGMYIALQATVNPGDDVILTDPYFDSYVHQIEAAGGNPVFIPTYEEDHFQIRKDVLKQAINSKTRGIIINTPSNPTGAI